MSTRLRLARLEQTWRNLPRRRCLACADWHPVRVLFPPNYAFTGGTPPPETWPESGKCPVCGRTPDQVVELRYVRGWRSVGTT